MCRNQSFRKLLQKFNYQQDLLRVELERVHHSRLASELPVLVHYVEGNFSWLFHVKPLFKLNVMRECLNGAPRETLMNFPSMIFNANIANGRIMDHWNQEPVLVSNVKFVNGPDGNIPSLVRLYLANDELVKIGSGDIYFQVLQGRFKMILGEINRESGLGPVLRGNQPINGLKPCVVETGPKIMNGIPESQSEFIDECSLRRVCKVALDEFAAAVRIDM